MKKIILFPVLFFLLLSAFPAYPQSAAPDTSLYKAEPVAPDIRKQSFSYAVKDTVNLGLDVYTKDDGQPQSKRPCVIFVFGGAFMAGRRDDSLYNRYFNSLVSHGYVLASVSYRLGLKGVRGLSPWHIAPLRKAIGMAVEDVYDATAWLIANATRLGIDTSKIILSGSSSGAITVLEAELGRRNDTKPAARLPENFEYAGVISFSGAILSFNGRPAYRIAPAPTLLFHGTADKIVPYDKIRFFNRGFFGSSWIAGRFKQKGYPYYIYRAQGLGHEESVLPMIINLPLILDFLNRFVLERRPFQIDMSFKDPDEKPMMVLTPKQLFKKLHS